MRGVTVLCAWVAIAMPARRVGAQDFAFNPALQWQGRAEMSATSGGTSVLVGGGVNLPAGYYVRLGIDGAAGQRVQDGAAGITWRTDLTARFLLDPFAEQRVGWYAGGGLSAVHDGASWRPWVTLLVGREGPTAGRWRSAVEGAIGGGVRLGVVVRRARVNGR